MTTTPVEQRSLTWRSLVRLALVGDLVLLLAQGAARRDQEALEIAAVMLLGAGLLRLRGGLAGLVLLCLSFANLELWMLPAALTNAGHHAGAVGILLPGALAAASLAGLAGGLAAIARRRDPSAGGGAARRVGLWTVAAVAGALVVAAVAGPGPAKPTPAGELELGMSNTAFHPATWSRRAAR